MYDRTGAGFALSAMASMALLSMPFMMMSPYRYGYGYGRPWNNRGYGAYDYLNSESSYVEMLKQRAELDSKIKIDSELFDARVIKEVAKDKNTKEGYSVRDQLREVTKYLVRYSQYNDVTKKQAVYDTFKTLNKMLDDKQNANDELAILSRISPTNDLRTGAICLTVGALLLGFSITSIVIAMPIALSVLGVMSMIVSIPLVLIGIYNLYTGARDRGFENKVPGIRNYAENPDKNYPKRVGFWTQLFSLDEQQQNKDGVEPVCAAAVVPT